MTKKIIIKMKKYKRISLSLYINKKNINYLNLNEYIWCDVYEKMMRKSIKLKNKNEKEKEK